MNLTGELAIVGVVRQQVSAGVRVGQIVDADDFESVRMAVENRFQGLAANAPEPVDAYTNFTANFMCLLMGSRPKVGVSWRLNTLSRP